MKKTALTGLLLVSLSLFTACGTTPQENDPTLDGNSGQTTAPTTDTTNDDENSNPAQEAVDAISTDGWTTYRNESFGYSISYPSSAVLEKPDASTVDFVKSKPQFSNLDKKTIEDWCFTIATDYTGIAITSPAPENQGDIVCGSTGAPAGEMTSFAEKFMVDGKEYIAEGFFVDGEGDTLDMNTMSMSITLDNQVSIQISSKIKDVAMPGVLQDYESEKALVRKIVESYQSI